MSNLHFMKYKLNATPKLKIKKSGNNKLKSLIKKRNSVVKL